MKFKSTFQKVMVLGCGISFFGMVLLFSVNHFAENGVVKSLAITCLTVFYHLGIRLFFGEWVLMKLIPKHPNYKIKYFRADSEFEINIYKKLNIRKASSDVPTYSPDEFSTENHSWEEIAEATVRSEIVHTVNVVLSFVPILFTLKFGSFLVFLITSVCAALFDLYFVVVQRYNRPRLARIAERENRRKV